MNENETIADIRKEAEGMFRSLCDKYHITYIGILPIMQEFNHIFDRIEAAWKREAKAIATENAVLPAVCITKSVGNAAAMREACVNIVEYARSARCHTDDAHVLGFLDQIERWAQAALAKPPRNCDRFNNEREMQFAFLAELLSMGINGASLEEYSKWLLAEAKGAGNESK
jgi:hypothetical protein